MSQQLALFLNFCLLPQHQYGHKENESILYSQWCIACSCFWCSQFFYSFYYFAPKLYSVKSLVTLSFGIMIDTSFLAHYFACSMHHFKMFACVDQVLLIWSCVHVCTKYPIATISYPYASHLILQFSFWNFGILILEHIVQHT